MDLTYDICMASVCFAWLLVFWSKFPNRAKIGLLMMCLAVGLNVFVVKSNNGKMPAKSEAFNHTNENVSGYVVIDETTKHPYLGDTINLGKFIGYCNPQDLLLFLGAIFFMSWILKIV